MRQPVAHRIPLVGLLAVAVTGCTVHLPDDDSPTPTPSVGSSTPPSTTSSTTSRSPSSRISTEAVPPTYKEAGTIRNGRPRTVSGTGTTGVRYRPATGTAVVVRLDCSRCSGPTTFTAAGRAEPWTTGQAPLSAVTLDNLFAAKDDTVAVVKTRGRWSMTLQSWNDPPFTRGAASGTGAAFVKLAGPGTRIRLTARPSKGTMNFRFKQAGPGGASRIIGGDEPLNETVDISTPAAVAVNGEGTWRLEPVR